MLLVDFSADDKVLFISVLATGITDSSKTGQPIECAGFGLFP